MKKHFLLIFSAVLLLACANSCDDALDNIGSDVIGSQFVVQTDTLYLDMTGYLSVENMLYNNDTLMLGEFYDSRYGNVKAEILAEVLPGGDTLSPTRQTTEGLWSNPTYKKLYLVLNNTLLNGNGNSPLKISVYQKTDTLTTGEKRFTDIDISKYCQQNVLLAEQWVTDDSLIHIPLPDNLGENLFNSGLASPADFKDSETFRTNIFKGLYLTSSSSGKDLIFNLFDITDSSHLNMQLEYQYNTFTSNDGTVENNTPRSETMIFAAKSSYPKAQSITNTINADRLTDVTFGFVSSPAGLRPTITIDLPAINDKLGDNPNLNRAVLTLKVPSEERISLPATLLPAPSYLMLIQKDSLKNFFENGKLHDGKTSFVVAKNGNQYQFDIARYIQQKKNDNAMDKIDEMLLVPVNYNSSSLILKEKIGLSGVCFYKDSIQVDFIFNKLNIK